MSQQITWIPPPKARKKIAKIVDAIDRVEVLAGWYRQHKPDVKRVFVTGPDYAAFESAVGTRGISLTADGLKFRGFAIVRAP